MMSLQQRLSLVIGSVLLAAFVGLELVSYHSHKQQVVKEVLNLAENIRGVLMATRRVYHHQFVSSGIELTPKTLGFLPAHAMSRISKDFPNWSDKVSLSFNNVSDQPRNRENMADAVEQEAIRHFREYPEEKVRFVEISAAQGDAFFHYARPIWVEPYCLECHGEREEAPATIRDNYSAAYGYQEGDLRGILSIKIPVTPWNDNILKQFTHNSLIHLGTFLLIFLLIRRMIQHHVTRPLATLATAMKTVAYGDYHEKLERLGGDFDTLGQTFNTMSVEIARSHGALRDEVTQHLQTLGALRESEERFKALVESATDAVISVDLNGLIVFWNRWAAQLFLYSEAESVGQHISIIVPARYGKAHEVAFGNVLRTRKLKSRPGEILSVVGRRKDGQEIPVEMTLSMWEVAGKLNFTAIIRDVRERKQLEEQLLHSQKMLAIGTLAGGIAHDFNNILGIILGNTELMALGIGTPGEGTQNIKDAVLRGRDLVRQLLAVGRRSHGQMRIINPVPLVKEVLKLLRSTLPSSIVIHERFPDAEVSVFWDVTQLHQVAMNLCTNAGQAMGEDGGELTVGLEPVEVGEDQAKLLAISPGRYLLFSVRDTGPGMTPELLSRIFEPFFTTKGVGNGTGLGLSVVHSAVKECGGGIDVISAPGQGALFNIFIPMVDADSDENLLAMGQSVLEPGVGRVLFVDDEAMLVDVGVRMLAALGYEPVGFTDSLLALSAFQAAPSSFAAVITDQTMPGMAGSALAEQMFALRPDIPIFLCTGYSKKMSAERADEVGFAGYFLKPVAFAELSKALKKVLQTRPNP